MKNEKSILLRLSKDDDKFIKDEADRHSMTKSAYLRYVAITKPQN
jgi:predicted DNA binding CopG/RHH family protein|tara:strand:+ start:107 stop:241 length:135 start_codon:yes stop_codon:yes gene_type:complete